MDYKIAHKMKELGFPQRRHDHAKYFINENTIAYFEDIKNAFKKDEHDLNRGESPVDWLENFTYIPELIDFVGPVQYNLTVDSAAFQWIDSIETGMTQEQLLTRFKDAFKIKES